MQMLSKVTLFLSSALLALGSAAACADEALPEKREAVIGVIDVNEPGYRSEFIAPTLAHLSKSLPGYRFRVAEIPAYQTLDLVPQERPDFIIGPSDIFFTLINSFGAQAIAARKIPAADDGGSAVASTLVVRADRAELQSIADLRGKQVAASLPDSLGGWLAFEGELRSLGFESEDFFGAKNFLTFQFPDVMQSVLLGKSDAGVLSACQLESAERAGLVEPGALRVIHEKADGHLDCRRSTALYPDRVFGVLDFSRPELVRGVAIALLSMPAEPGFSWQVAGQLNSVGELYRTLGIGPFAPRPFTFLDFYQRYKAYILGALGVLLILLLDELRLTRMVTRRTEDLEKSLAENKRLSEVERQSRARLAHLERSSLVSNLSSMIAHELKQPLAAILNYSEVARMKLEDEMPEDSDLDEITGKISAEARRITGIVDRVRSYAREEKTPHVTVRLDDILKTAVLNFRQYQEYREFQPEVTLSTEKDLFVSGDALELEILAVNLMKNAARAARNEKPGRIEVKARRTDSKICLAVSDNGPKLSEDAFRKLSEITDSTNPEGLRLGLSIVRGIADSHGASFTPEQLSPQGIQFRILFDEAPPPRGFTP